MVELQNYFDTFSRNTVKAGGCVLNLDSYFSNQIFGLHAVELISFSLVPTRSSPAHSTRLGTKCRDVTKYRAKSSEREDGERLGLR